MLVIGLIDNNLSCKLLFKSILLPKRLAVSIEYGKEVLKNIFLVE
jgi:hypothetical protein